MRKLIVLILMTLSACNKSKLNAEKFTEAPKAINSTYFVSHKISSFLEYDSGLGTHALLATDVLVLKEELGRESLTVERTYPINDTNSLPCGSLVVTGDFELNGNIATQLGSQKIELRGACQTYQMDYDLCDAKIQDIHVLKSIGVNNCLSFELFNKTNDVIKYKANLKYGGNYNLNGNPYISVKTTKNDLGMAHDFETSFYGKQIDGQSEYRCSVTNQSEYFHCLKETVKGVGISVNALMIVSSPIRTNSGIHLTEVQASSDLRFQFSGFLTNSEIGQIVSQGLYEFSCDVPVPDVEGFISLAETELGSSGSFQGSLNCNSVITNINHDLFVPIKKDGPITAEDITNVLYP